MRVLVTGGTGFLGAHLVAALGAAGHDVLAFDVAAPGGDARLIAPGIEARVRSGQIGDLARLLEVCRVEAVEAIVHAAGIVGLETSLAQPVATYATNVMGSVNVLEVARQLGLARVVFLSSNAAYHPGEGGTLVETGPCFSVREGNPAAHYGTSKMAAEAIGLAYATFQGVDFVALRVTAIYGFGMRSPMYVKPMVEDAVLGRPTRFATGGPMRRDYTHVLDCCEAVALALAAPRWPAGEQRVLNVARGVAHTAAEVAETVRRVVPGADIEIGPTLTPLEAANVRMRAPLDVTAARRVLGWSPRWSLEDGVRQYAEAFRRSRAAPGT